MGVLLLLVIVHCCLKIHERDTRAVEELKRGIGFELDVRSGT